jgi:hypothetical protein
LNIVNKREEISNNNRIINSINQIIKEKESQNDLKEQEIKQFQKLPSYIKSLKYLKEIDHLEKQKEELLGNISDIANQLSKAAHKYSYGSSKVTKEIINTIINEPVKILEEKEISPYVEFLNNLKDSINKNKIVLKDSAKVIQYCDKLIEDLPKFKEESTEIISKIEHMKELIKDSPLEKITEIKNEINENKKNIQAEVLRKEDLNNQTILEEERLEKITEKTEEQLFYLFKKKYKIK